MKWGYHGGTEIYIADRLGSLNSYGISVPFFNMRRKIDEYNIFNYNFGGLNYEKSRYSYGKRK